MDKLIAKNLLQINAIKLNPQNPFTWASGMRSPIYCDNRITLSHPDVRTLIKKSLASLVPQFGEVHMISAVATAGIAHGALLADYLHLPFSYVRSAPKEHGRQNQIEGDISPDMRILVLEDLISTGGSSLEVVHILREKGYEVAGVLAIFDYGFEKAREKFMNSACKYRSLSNYTALLEEALETHYISEEEAKTLQVWSTDPQNWFQTFFKHTN